MIDLVANSKGMSNEELAAKKQELKRQQKVRTHFHIGPDIPGISSLSDETKSWPCLHMTIAVGWLLLMRL